MNRYLSTTLVALLGLAFSATTFAAKPEEAVKYRQGVMNAQSWNMNAMGAMVKGEKPYDKVEVERNVAIVEALSQATAWSQPRPESGGKRRATTAG